MFVPIPRTGTPRLNKNIYIFRVDHSKKIIQSIFHIWIFCWMLMLGILDVLDILDDWILES